MKDDDTGGLEGLPRPSESPAESSDRFVTHLATVLVTVGWLGGAATAGFAVYAAVLVYGGDLQSLPDLFDEWRPGFRDRPTFSALKVLVGGLLLSLVPVLVITGMGHLLRVFVGVDRGLRRVLARLEERE
jgi:hypothetical protein